MSNPGIIPSGGLRTMRDRKIRFLVISGVVILASSAVAAGLKDGQQIPPPVIDKEKIGLTSMLRAVPDLTGKREGVEVAKTLDKAGLRVGETTYEPTPAGWQIRVVLRQNPVAGSKIPKGGRVNIVVTLGPAGGPRDVRVPGVVGQTIEEATRNLERVGLLTDVISSFAGPSTVNVVDRQDPAADRTAKVGTRVALTASSDVLVPNVVGLTEARAYGLISQPVEGREHSSRRRRGARDGGCRPGAVSGLGHKSAPGQRCGFHSHRRSPGAQTVGFDGSPGQGAS